MNIELKTVAVFGIAISSIAFARVLWRARPFLAQVAAAACALIVAGLLVDNFGQPGVHSPNQTHSWPFDSWAQLAIAIGGIIVSICGLRAAWLIAQTGRDA
ncbi:MAG: hypothetical protein AAGE01_11645 [Pseudomonadota bacterium]